MSEPLHELFRDFIDSPTDDAARPFFIDAPGSVRTLGEARDAVAAARAGLVLMKAGESLALVCTNCWDFVVAFIAASLHATRLYLIGEGEAQVLVSALGEPTVQVLDAHAQTALARMDVAAHAAPTVSPRLQRIGYFTSGTTGGKKLLALAPSTLLRRLRQWTSDFRLAEGSTFFCTTAFAHSHGLNLHLLPALCLRGTLMAPRLDVLTTGTLSRLMAARRPDLFSAMPQLMRLMALAPGAGVSLRQTQVISGSDSLDAEDKAAFEQRFDCTVHDQYGCAETGPVYLLRHDAGRRYLHALLGGRRVDLHEDARGLLRLSVTSDSACDEIWHDGRCSTPSRAYALADWCARDARGVYLVGRNTGVHVLPGGDTVDLQQVERAIEGTLGCECVVLAATLDCGAPLCLYVGAASLAEDVQALALRQWPAMGLQAQPVARLITTSLGKKVRTMEAYAA